MTEADACSRPMPLPRLGMHREYEFNSAGLPIRYDAADAEPWGRIVFQGLRQKRFFYGWYIVGAGAVNSFVTLGMTAFGLGVFIQPIRDEMGWSLTAIGVGYSIRSFEAGL